MRQISVILPTHNEKPEGLLREILDRLGQHANFEVIVVDHGSCNDTLEFIKKRGMRLLSSNSRHRSTRINEGVRVAKNEWMLLHHPRSLIAPEGLAYLSREELPQWGAFTHQFDSYHFLLKFTSWYSNHIRGDLRQIYYLDHCLFLNKEILQNKSEPLVPEVAIFEDTKFCLKLRQMARPQRLPYLSTTSSIRFQKNGIFYQSLLNQVMKLAYFLGFSDEAMNKLYEKGLSLNSKY